MQRTITITAGQYSDPIYTPGTAQPLPVPLTVAITPSNGGTAKIQYTLSSAAAVMAGTATWRDWPLGTVSAFAVDLLLGPVTAIRGNATTVDAVMEVAA